MVPMNPMDAMRNTAFWTLDKLRGSRVHDAYREISSIDLMDSSDPYIQEHQRRCWERLKRDACTDVVRYSGMSSLDFAEFPIITKNDIREDQESFLSKAYRIDELVQMSTSGSTGTPFVCYQDGEKKKRVNAEVIYYSEKVGYVLGSNLSYIRTVVKQNRKSILRQYMQNQTLVNCMSLDSEGIEEMLQTLRRLSKHERITLLGYGSTYTAIKDYAQSKGIDILPDMNVIGVISGSDMLFDETRQVISRLFGGVTTVSRYSNEENGVLGQDEGINNVFAINEADYIIEICDEEGAPVPDGCLGRIVVTDLFNKAMPMIRYDTGDVGAIRTFDLNGRKKRCICDFSGRSVDVIYDTRGNALSPHAITNYMWSFPDVKQYQVVQTGSRDYRLVLNLAADFDRRVELINLMHELLGTDAEFEIAVVDEIPVLASGKRRYVVNEWKH